MQRIVEIGRKGWKQQSGYHRRSLCETAIFPCETIIGPALSSQKPDTRKTEAAVGIHCLNTFTAPGMPDSVKIFRTLGKAGVRSLGNPCNNAPQDR